MAFRKRGGLAMFQIMNSSNVLSQCISYFPSTYATQQTCFTSVSQYLNEDDDLFVQINGDDSFTVDFETGKSFFELVILSPSSI